MSLVRIVILSLVGLGVLLSATLAAYAQFHSDHPIVDTFRNVMIAGFVRTLAAFCLMAPWIPGSPAWWDGMVNLGAALTAVTFFEFACKYTGSPLLDRRWVRGTAWGFVAVVGLLTVTTDFHEIARADQAVTTYEGLILFTYEPTVVFGLIALGLYLFVIAALVLLARFTFRTTTTYRKQCAVIFAATLLVLFTDFAFGGGTWPHPDLKLTPILYVAKDAIVFAAIFRYDLLRLLPLARDRIVETIDDPVVVLDSEDVVAYANDATQRLGVTESEFEQPVESLLPGLIGAIEDDSIFQYEPPVVTDGGSAVSDERVFDPRVDGIVDQHGIEQGQVVVLHDITEQKRREERLEGFASIVSHDLRNPLNIAAGNLAIERDRDDSEHLQAVDDSLDRMEQLIDELLELARKGYDDIDPELLDLEYVAATAWETVASGESTMTVDPADQPILADEHQFREIFENLFRNAIEHNDEPVRIDVGRTEHGFYVADDGAGIPEDQQEEVFESGHTTAEDGTGYGLHIVEQFAAAHGWAVTVTDSETGGARFEFVCS